MLAGNSSSGIIEAATFGTPVVNIGDRQRLRERNANVIDVAAESRCHRAGLRTARWDMAGGRVTISGARRGRQAHRQLLATLPAGPQLLEKVNSY